MEISESNLSGSRIVTVVKGESKEVMDYITQTFKQYPAFGYQTEVTSLVLTTRNDWKMEAKARIIRYNNCE